MNGGQKRVGKKAICVSSELVSYTLHETKGARRPIVGQLGMRESEPPELQFTSHVKPVSTSTGICN